MKTSFMIAGSLALVQMTYAQDKPNIISYWQTIWASPISAVFGGEIHTPVLDKLAKNGVRMTQMYKQCPVVCPSRATC